ncbi:DALR domain-containing protein, partial [Oceanithermus sp.]
KEDPRDWALWKRAEPEHIMRWPSPWGEGYPGWHIECSAMSLKYLGEGFDIHAGGIDLQFPHHECEIAQAEAAGHAFARYWMHHNHVLLNGEKMAKSTGNFITLRELLEKHEPMVVRFYLLQSHYRSVLDLTDAGLEAAAKAYFRLLEAYRSLRAEAERAREGRLPALDEALDQLERDFADAMNDDLGTPEAIAALFSFLPELNKALAAGEGRESLVCAREALERLGEGVLGLFPSRVLEARLEGPLLEGLIELLLEQREAARQRRDFATADAIRARLADLGVIVEDTPQGAKWRLAPPGEGCP